jgi:hypothetical protein
MDPYIAATAILCVMLVQSTVHLPHKTRTLESGDKIVSKCLQSSWPWKDSLLGLNTVNFQLNLNKVFLTRLNRICNESFPEYSTKKQGDNFARNGQCDN